ncbi:biotin-dependent carboxyltransferase family protein [Simiduia agarivorans]|uniref:Allophanate hydrolase domain-containing protein n=1 Tax=Simiduia agarivorans (strain DSM 21679 / JCM 13881 / BCRC 17597 / SA1) TaxID=1117647 RepID=K4KK78_SIMAS|nr:biotin-dependent carboxyltransferase family protein [Simiduia agarivorans]AFU99559.1 allophanate hydrolase domain-containing protein [Simiduia agarivorans SA1 = DSM 21679]
MSHLQVLQPGMLALLMDTGRTGQHGLGLTTGGPLDAPAFFWANTLAGNPANATAIEVAVGGLELRANTDLMIAVTGAEVPLTIDGQKAALWTSHWVNRDSKIKLGFASKGARAYLAANGGFDVAPQFGSTATVVREGIGGLNGKPLAAGDSLTVHDCPDGHPLVTLPEALRPQYPDQPVLRVIEGYQADQFSPAAKAVFYSSDYTLSPQCDRMGFRLQGPKLACAISGIVSEGISLGAIQVPADGQPIVLLHDRQTIGGYPKIGNVFSGDLYQLGQLMPGASVRFAPMSLEQAHAELLLARRRQHLAKEQLELVE